MGKMEFVNVTVYAVKDRENYMVFSPSFNVYGYSDTNEKDAKEDFLRSVERFINYHYQKGNLNETLNRLGWQLVKEKVSPPKNVTISSGMLSLLSGSTMYNVHVGIPAMAS